MISTTAFTTVLIDVIGYECFWNFKKNITLPVKVGDNVHGSGGLFVRRVLHGYESQFPSVLRYFPDDHKLTINLRTISTKADNVPLFISCVRSDLNMQQQEVG
jgi:hypothetical protein